MSNGTTTHPALMRPIARATGLLAVGGSLISLAGWVFSVPRLMAWDGSGISMKTNAALCTLALSCAVVALALPRRGHEPLGLVRCCAAFAAVLGLATLCEHAFGWNLGIDTVLFDEIAGERATAAPNRMGPPASTCFVLLGAGLLLLCKRGGPLPGAALLLGTAVILVTSLSLIGYVYGASELFEISSLTGIALQTAVMVSALGWGVCALAVDRGASIVIAREGPGGILARKLAVVAVFVPLVVGFVTLLLLHQLSEPLAIAAQTLIAILMLLYFVVRAARELESSSEALTKSEARYRTVFERAPIGVLELDPQTITILQANEAYCRIIGRTADEVIGHKPAEFTHPDDREGDEQITSSARAGRSFAQAKRYIRPDGGVVYVHVNGQGITAAHSAPSTIAIVSDVTPLHQAEQERSRLLDSERAARQEAERAARSKDEFVAMVSHELRTPLNGILGWAQLMKRDPGDEVTARRALEAIERGVRAQSRLVEDLLDMSRITAGRMRLSVEMTQVIPVVQAALDTIKPAAEAKQLRLVTILDPLAGPVVGDPERLQQIVWNLLSNAVKFTPRGGAIHVHLRRVESHVEITVSDTGQGISADVLPHIFDRYRQSDTSISRRFGGLGLGLAIVKQLVELHGGTVSAASPGDNQGATFCVCLPLALLHDRRVEGDPVAVADGTPDVTRRDLADIRVLLIDDDEEALELASRLLAEHGALVDMTTSGAQGLAMLSANPPHILLCDLGMPEMNGYEVVQRLRTTQPRLPAVAVTAFARAEDRIRSLAAGFNMHLSKPLDARELVTVVAALARAGMDARN